MTNNQQHLQKLDLSNLVLPTYHAGGVRTLHSNLQCERKPMPMNAEIAASIVRSVNRVLFPSSRNHDTADGILVNLMEFLSPSSFIIQKCDDNVQKMYNRMHEELNAIVIDIPFLQSSPPIGSLIAALFDGVFARAQVTNVKQSSNKTVLVCVYFVDYGNESTVSLMDLRELPPTFATIPFQALHVQLADVVPIDAHGLSVFPCWSESDILKMYNLLSERNVNSKPCVVKMVDFAVDGRKLPTVDLLLPNELDGTPNESLAELLVSASLASRTNALPVIKSSNNSQEKAYHMLVEENCRLRAQVKDLQKLVGSRVLAS